MQKIPLTNASCGTRVPSFIQEQVSLADKNWFGTGGPAHFYTEPTTISSFQEALSFAARHHLDLFVLGSGANILISDEGFKGLVIKPALKEIEIIDETSEHVPVKVGAGVVFHDLIQYCLDRQLIGLEEFSGIPGTVGGSVYINIHYFEFLLSQFLEAAEVMNKETGALSTVDASWFNFGYNQSTLQEKNYFLVSATLRIKKASALETACARGRHQEIIRHRQRRYPTSGTCGSFFRNFFDHEISRTTAQGKKLIYVAYYLDMLGIKGDLSVGGAVVSHQHANMIVNTGSATTSDIISLAQRMQEKVYQTFGIIPEPECQLIGFTTYPLMQQ